MRYLCLTSREQLETHIDTWWERIVGDRLVWGPDLDGWERGLSVDDNLRRRFGSLHDFDAVFLSAAFHAQDQGVCHPVPSPALIGNRPTVAFVHEVLAAEGFHLRQREPICRLDGIDIVLHPYTEAELDPYLAARELARLEDRTGRRTRQYYKRVPHHVRTDLFAPPSGGTPARDIDVLLVGRCREPLYPLRTRWARLFRDRTWESAVRRPVPYGQQWFWSDAERREQLADYASQLWRARIVLTCSSSWRYMLPAYTEIAAAGAFIISDVPTQMPLEFTRNIGVVSGEMPDGELVEVVGYWLRETEERERRAARLAAHVREHFRMESFWNSVDQAVLHWNGAAVTPA